MAGGRPRRHDRRMAAYDVGGPAGPAGRADGTGSPPPPPGPPHRAPRQLRRSRSNRVVAGVAGGLGRYAGVDPVVFRVSFVVLTVFGGAGLLLYLVGWLIIPDEADAVSPAEALVGRGRSSMSTVVAVLLVVGAAAALAAAVTSGGDSLTALALAVVAVVLLLRRQESRQEGGQEGGDRAPQSGPPAAGSVTGGWAPVPSLLRLGETAAVLASEAERARVAELVTAACGAGLLGLEEADRRLARIFASRTRGQLAEVVAELPPEWVDRWERDAPAVPPPVPPAPLPPPAAVAPVPPPRHERSALGWATLSLLAVALGVTTALDVGTTQMLAVATGVVGAGLLVGAWYGRARWLALLGIPLALATVVASTLPVDVRGGAGTRTFRPVDTAAISPAYRLGAGEVTLDLGGVVFGRSARTAVEVGAGQVRVLVPPRVDVTVRARAGIGQTQVLGSRDAGLGVDRTSTDDGPDGPGGGQLDLTASVGVGQVEVLRAAS
ncbi:MAG TPA: PspC domain-containing protein [Frankiaceae bacterium]|nr:PspC domain-containing protein [Frankiaceae bacterium]